jgi:hypothetical protein
MKFPFPLKVTVPPTDRSNPLRAVYVPGVNTIPASSETMVPGGSVEYAVYAALALSSAWFAAGVVSCIVAGGTTTPGGKPTSEVPGYNPRFPPMITVFPEFVTVELPRTAKFAADASC